MKKATHTRAALLEVGFPSQREEANLGEANCNLIASRLREDLQVGNRAECVEFGVRHSYANLTCRHEKLSHGDSCSFMAEGKRLQRAVHVSEPLLGVLSDLLAKGRDQ